MNQQQITDEVKRLAKKIAEYWRMKPYRGCWIKTPDELLLFEPRDMFLDGVALRFTNGNYSKDWFPIFSIGDCLEKLLELGYESMNLQRRPFKHPWIADVWDKESHDLEANTINRWEDKGKSLHEIALSVLLAALKEGSDKNNEEAYWERKKREQRKEHEYHLKMVRETEGNEPK